MSTCPNENGYIFSDYILKSYIESGCLFPPELWASEPSISPRTTNGAESFHKMYNGQFHSAHPPTHVLISVLMEIQAETMTKINSIARNVHSKMGSSDLKRVCNVIEHFNNYKTHKNIIKYLTSIGFMYQGKKLY
ncbi:unnamed protein product [Macrosiphum euphorbiae]|uniref:Uncharacterized protein n=1 Tax=Macrosiphum euphorbiae TaxID=13131 RepID=A0AAV0XXX5_9HEMI|nr:unnamed protein product [Macrosiphum euphorbiae]